MSQICPYCEASKKIKKNGTYTVFNEFSAKEVLRFFCRSCGMSFSEHTSVYLPKRENKKDPQVVNRLKSKYKKEKETALFSQITDYLTSYGLPKIDEITDELRISSKTYYKYLRKFKYDLKDAVLNDRAKLSPKNLLLLEVNKIHKKTETKIRFFLLIDLASKAVFNYFFYEKKKIRDPWEQKLSARIDEDNTQLGYTYNSNHIEKFLINLKNKYPDLSIQLSCSNYLKSKLLKSDPLLFENAKHKNAGLLNSNLNDYGINRVLSFAYTLEIKKYAKYASVPSSLYKEKIEETLRMLVFIYNKHQLELFAKKSLKEQHRRRSKRDKNKYLHIVRRKKSTKDKG